MMAQQLQLRSPRLEEVRECRRLLRVLPSANSAADGPLAAEAAQVKVVQQAAAYIDQLHKELLERMFPFAGDTRGVQTLMESLLPPAFFAAALQPSPRRVCRSAAPIAAGRSRQRRSVSAGVGRPQRKAKLRFQAARPRRPVRSSRAGAAN